MLLAVMCLVSLVLVLGTPEDRASRAQAAPPGSSFEWGPCPDLVPKEAAGRVKCGVLTVPESRAEGSTSQRTIKLPVVWVASRSATPKPDPVVLPTLGGPGASSFWGLWLFLEYDWATGDRDGIVIEQRGNPDTLPTLACPELDPRIFYSDGRRLPADEADAVSDGAVRACHDRLTREGVDLSAYTSTESAADLADLRRALGYDQWNLYGVSYGARLALTVMRDQPAGLRSVILDGVYPTDVDLGRFTPTGLSGAVRSLVESCAVDAGCRAHYPDVEGQLRELLDRTRQTPITAGVRIPSTGERVLIDIDDADIAQGLFDALYDNYVTSALPFVLDQLARGNTDMAAPLAQRNLDSANQESAGLWWSVNCAEELPFYSPDPPPRPDAVSEHLVAETDAGACAPWPVTALPATENDPVRSDIPALLLNGGRDPITPPAFGDIAAQGLSRHFNYVFPNLGHGAVWHLWWDGCHADSARQFLDDPTVEPDAGCIENMRPIDFLTTDDIHPTSAIFRLDSDVIRPLDPVQLGLVTASLAVLVGALAYGVVTLIRRKGRAPHWGIPATLAAASSNLALAGGLAFVVLRTDPLILGFGVPTGALPWLLAGGLLALSTTVALTAVSARAWLKRDGAVGHRVALTVVAVAAVTFCTWLAARGLLFM